MEREFRSRGYDNRSRGGFDDRSRSFEKPVKEGEVYELEVTELAEKGDGIARKEGFVIFVPNTKKGDKVSVRITRVLRRFAIGEIVEAAAPAEAPAEGAEEAEAPEAEAPAEGAEEAEAPEAEPEAEEPKEKKESKKSKKSKDEDIVEFEE